MKNLTDKEYQEKKARKLVDIEIYHGEACAERNLVIEMKPNETSDFALHFAHRQYFQLVIFSYTPWSTAGLLQEVQIKKKKKNTAVRSVQYQVPKCYAMQAY